MTEKTIQEIVKGWANNPSSSTELNSEEYKIICNNYDDYVINSMGYNLWYEFYDYIDSFINNNMKVLDVCCGTGLVGERLSEKGFGYIYGVDLSDMMLDVANKKGIYNNLTQHDMNEQFISDELYDMVVCLGSLTYFNDKQVLENIFSQCKKDGIIVLSHRDDLYKSQHYNEYFEKHSCIDIIDVEYSLPYLPKDPNYDINIKVNLIILRKTC